MQLTRADGSTGLSNSEATARGLKQYAHGTTYNGGIAPTTTGSGVTIQRAVYVPYQCQGGEWRLKFNVQFTHGGATSLGIAVAGIAFKNVASMIQNGCGTTNQSAFVRVLAQSVNVNTIDATASVSSQTWGISGDIELDSKPTWAY